MDNTILRAIESLAVANRILAREGVVDAYGHIAMRHPLDPSRFFLARSLSPEQVSTADIVEHDLDGQPIGTEPRALYIERFIHAAVFANRPDVMAVVHAHAEDVLPFTITAMPLVPVIHDASDLDTPPVWDIDEEFGSNTTLLVSNLDQGRSLARRLGDKSVVLMRGHGFVAAATSLEIAVRLAITLPRNARVLTHSMMMGQFKPLAAGELAARRGGGPDSLSVTRAWNYWAARSGCRCQSNGEYSVVDTSGVP